MFDYFLASAQQRKLALDEARFAIQRHGVEAEAMLREKLHDPRRRRSLRIIRIALREVRKNVREHAA